MSRTILDSRQIELRERLDNVGTQADATLTEVLRELNKTGDQLRIKPESTISQRVVISAASLAKDTGFSSEVSLGGKLVDFEGVVINFETGAIFEADGVTSYLAGANNFTPFALAANEYVYYSVVAKAGGVNADNTIGLEISVTAAASANASLASAPKANFATGSALAQVWVRENGTNTGILNIDWANISQVSGSAGGGSAEDLEDHINDTSAHGVAGNVVGTTDTQTLTNKTITGANIQTPVRSDVKQDTKANLVTYATTASNGQLVFATDTKELLQVIDGVLEAVGAGGGIGGVDILFVQDFESAALSDFTQTGLVLSDTNPLKGTVSARLTHDSVSNRSFKQIVAVDEKFRNRNITLKLNIKSAANAGNVTLTVRDETNAVNLVSSEQLPISNAVGGAIGIVTFNMPSTCLSFSYEVIALPQVGSPVTIVDDIIAELSISSLLTTSVTIPIKDGEVVGSKYAEVVGEVALAGLIPADNTIPQISEGTQFLSLSYTPKRAGNKLRIKVDAYIVENTNSANNVAIALFQDGGANAIASAAAVVPKNDFDQGLMNISKEITVSSTSAITFTVRGGAPNGATTLNRFRGSGDFNLGNTAVSSITVEEIQVNDYNEATEIPLAQSVIVQEADSVVSLQAANGYGSSGTAIRRFSTIRDIKGSDIEYVDSPVNGASFTIKKEGIYSIHYTETFSSATGNSGISLNASSLTTGIQGLSLDQILSFNTANSSGHGGNTSWQGYLKVGDIIRPHTGGAAGTAPGSTFVISRQGSLKQLNPNPNSKITIPTSELRMEGASTRGAVATAIVRFDNVAKIRGDAFEVVSNANDGTRIRMLKKGKLDISVGCFGSSVHFAISRNQAVLTALPVASETLTTEVATATTTVSLSCPVFVEVNDIIRVAANGNPTANFGNSLNLSFQEQDIAVAVTNVLPQFSQSDSSVRVDTANGYGSTATRIRRFSNIRDNIGTDIEYVDSATLGASFTVKSAGVYNISYSENNSGTAGISLNSSQLTTNIENINVADRLIIEGDNRVAVGWSGYLNVGDVIRPHSDGNAAATNSQVNFTISKVGKPNVTGVDVTPFVNVQLDNLSNIQSAGPLQIGAVTTAPTKGTIARDVVNVRRIGDSLEMEIDYVQTAGGGAGSGAYLITVPQGLRIDLNKVAANTTLTDDTFNSDRNRLGEGIINTSSGLNPISLFAYDNTRLYMKFGLSGSLAGSGFSESGAVFSSSVSNFSIALGIKAKISIPIVGWEATSSNIITPSESFSSDTAQFTYANAATYTLSTLANAPVGTYITFTYAANTNTRTQTTGVNRPTQTDSDMNVNGIRVFSRAYNAASTSGNPSAIAIQVGKGFKGKSLELFKSTGKVNGGSVDIYLDYVTGTRSGLSFKEYNESTGILIIDAGFTYQSYYNVGTFHYGDLTSQSDGYLVINASKSPALVGVPQLLPRIATISDVKATGIVGGTATSGSWQIRTLNTLADPTGIVTSLASNQFTLAAGTYYIEASAPAYKVNGHKCRLQNITASTTISNGTTEYTAAANGVTNRSHLKTEVTISTASVFELQHAVQTTTASFGFGDVAGGGILSSPEVYTQVKITRVR